MTDGLNKDLLLKVYNFIAIHPEKHNQESWGDFYVDREHEIDELPIEVSTSPIYDRVALIGIKDPKVDCGTAACFAGWTCLMNGDKMQMPFSVGALLAGDVPSEVSVFHVEDKNGNEHSISNRAFDLLGLGPHDAYLFEASNSRKFLRAAVLSLLNDGYISDNIVYDNESGDYVDDEDGDIEPIVYDPETHIYA